MSDTKTHGTVHEERAMILRTHVGNGQVDNPVEGKDHQAGELVELFTVTTNGCPGVRYRGRYWTLGWEEIVGMALTAIDAELDE